MKLNPKKCTFGIEEDMFPWLQGKHQGDKGMSEQGGSSAKPTIPKVSERCTKAEWEASKPKQKSDFQWTAEAEVAFKQMKELIVELPTLIAPVEKEELIVYLATAREAVSAVLITEREVKQVPVYFVSRALQVERPEDDPLDTPMEAEEELPDPWTLFTDGSSCVDGSGAGLILTNPEGAEFTYALRFRFDATNNEVEYEALIAKDCRTNGCKKSPSKRGLPLIKELSEKSINVVEVLAVVEEEGDTWITPMYNYLTEETLPAEKEKARAIR
ncbi:reverse transcriptase domain-containing protein, partial [Tanacetum coccineum]